MIRYLLTILLSCGITVSSAAAQKNYTVSGDSMSPTLIAGDTVVIDETNPNHRPQPGDMVAIRISADTLIMVKRVMAVEGNRVEFRDGSILVNSEIVGDFDSKRWTATVKQLERNDWIVPTGFLFILGDNPANSRDSKRLGLIAVSQVEGKVVRVVKNK